MKQGSVFSFSKISTFNFFLQSILFQSSKTSFLMLLISLVVSQQTVAQTIVDEGTYDLQFEKFVAGCGSITNDYCVQLQIKSASDVETFAIGSYTFYFTFNNNAIGNPTYQSINFGNNGTCAGGNAAYMESAFFADVFTGEANVTTIMELPNQGCPLVSSSWQNIGLVCFEVIDEAETTELSFGTDFTEVNKNDDTPRHNQGTFNTLNVLPVVINSPANVELSPEAPTMASLCSDEAYSLIADLSTLSFGPQVGDNPVVGWSVSTTNPGDASPLLAEGYTEIIIAGDAITTAAVITGTNDGFDPYELGVSTLWFSPITFINFDEASEIITIDFACFDWGEAVQIGFLADGTEACPSSCTANVDLSDQIGQDIGICSDESVTLLADVNTLDFGEDVGNNPLIGWAVFTDIPDGNNPFEDPNYTGSIVAGNASTTGITINGTNNGFDPFGFNLNALSFVPITFINYDPDANPALSLDSNCFDWGEFVTVSFYADGFGDCPLPCDANVEMADGVALVETLCVDETHELRVNTATLDFGVEEGNNPKVGWAISTIDPGEESPLGQDGFSGSAIPGGSGADNTITVIGTADGLDPYGLGVSTIWLTPVTFTDYDAMNNDFTFNNDCFDWGENVQITFVVEGEGDCNPVPQCPTTASDFSANESLCDGATPTIPSDEMIFNSLDDASNAVINWSIDPNSPLAYSGDGCEVQTVEFTLTITCSEDETVSIEAGTFSINLYPTPQAPTVVFSNAEICSYTVLPNCPNDVVSPSEVSDQVPGSIGIIQDFMVSNGGCSAVSFEGVVVPDCQEVAPQCPTSVDDFSGSESLCDVGIPNVPTNEAILASMDDSMNAVIEWSIAPSLPIVYEGDGCNPQQIDYVLTIRCSDDANLVLNGGTHTVTLYPSPQAPTVNIVSVSEVCSYELIPNCENDVLDPPTIESQAAGSGELVQIIKVTNEGCSGLNFFDVSVPACPSICPTSAGNFTTNENLCEGETPTVPSNETILASVDLPEGATIRWSQDPTLPLIYDGDGCNSQAIIFSLTIGCQVDGSIQIPAGTHIVNLYPSPQAPIIEFVDNVDGVCSYTLVPACENDVVTPSTVEDLPAGTIGMTLPFNVSNEGCGEASFSAIEVPDCLVDDIDLINFPNQLQMEVSPNFLQIGTTSLIEVYLPQSSHTILEVLNISGQRIAVLQQGSLQSDVHSFEWNVEALSSGLYFVHLQTEYGHEVRKVVVE